MSWKNCMSVQHNIIQSKSERKMSWYLIYNIVLTSFEDTSISYGSWYKKIHNDPGSIECTG